MSPRTKVTVHLSPGDIVRISCVVYAAARELRDVLGEHPGPDWYEASGDIKNECEIAVRLIIAQKVKTPEALHARWRDHMVKDGWRWGLVRREDEKRHPAIVDFKELAPLQQAKYALFFEMTRMLELAYAAHRMAEQRS